MPMDALVFTRPQSEAQPRGSPFWILVEMPFVPSSYLFLVVRPGAPTYYRPCS